jgi:hypothetical protein
MGYGKPGSISILLITSGLLEKGAVNTHESSGIPENSADKTGDMTPGRIKLF